MESATVKFEMSAVVSVTRRNCPDRCPTKPATQASGAVRANRLHTHRLAEQRAGENLSLAQRSLTAQRSVPLSLSRLPWEPSLPPPRSEPSVFGLIALESVHGSISPFLEPPQAADLECRSACFCDQMINRALLDLQLLGCLAYRHDLDVQHPPTTDRRQPRPLQSRA